MNTLRWLFASVLLLGAPGAFSAAGALDPSFASGGLYVAPDEPGGTASAMAIALQADGKVLVAGRATDPALENVVVARLLANGAIDTSFGAAGFARFAPGTVASTATGIAVLADGRIVVAGHYVDGSQRNQGFVARLTSAGQPDAAYGDAGIRRINVAPALGATVRGLVIQPDGKAVVGGSLLLADNSTDMFAARVDANGTVDSGFGVGGVARSALAGPDEGYAVALTPSGAIVVAGDHQANYLAVMQVLPGGTLDASMRGDGIFLLGTPSRAFSVAVQPDGKIVVSGHVNSGGGFAGAFVRLLSSGILDATFDGDGIAFVVASPASVFGAAMKSVLLGMDGFIYGVGAAGFARHAWVRRVSSAGVADETWNNFWNLGNSDNVAGVMDGQGRIVIASSGPGPDTDSPNTSFGVSRVLPDQTLDTAFGTSGTSFIQAGLIVPLGSYSSMALDPEGRMWTVARTTCAGNQACVRVRRLLPDGTPDPTLTTSVVKPPLGTFPLLGAVALQPDGRLLFATNEDGNVSSARRWRLFRLDVDGSLDAAFSAPTPEGTNFMRTAAGHGWIRVYPDGRIVFATSDSIRRLLPNGAVDPDFNMGGVLNVGNMYDGTLLPSGGFITAGTSLKQFGPDGFVDFSFGSSGVVEVGHSVHAVVVQDDGRILTAGSPGGVVRVRRFTSAGAAEGSIDVPGVAPQRTFDSFFGSIRKPLAGLRLQPDGKTVVAGTDGGNQPPGRMFAARLEPGLSMDSSFGTNGVAFVASTSYDVADTMALGPQGGIFLGGSTSGPPGRYAIAKLTTGVEVSSGPFPVGGVGVAYGAPLQARGGVAPYSFAVGGTLPPGLAVTGSTLGGTPTIAGLYAFTITATDSTGASAGRPLSIRVHSSGSLVASYYQTILNRAPDAGGQQFWQNEAARVASLGASVSEVFYAMAGAFFGSPEYTAGNPTNSQFVTDLYQTFFNRDPDAGGLAYWAGEIAAGKSRAAVLNDFLFSGEFAEFMGRVFGSAATSRAEVSMVMDFYRGVLGRLPDDGGFNYWLARFRAAQCNGNVVAEADAISALFLSSGEYASRRGGLNPLQYNAAFVTDLYNAVLKRGGDRPGIEYWVNQINSGARTHDQVRQAFVASPEFQGRVQAVLAQGCIN